MSDWEVRFLLIEASRRTLEAGMDAIEKRYGIFREKPVIEDRFS